MFSISRRRSTSERVSFTWCFTDEEEEEVEVEISATCHPEEPERITADPYYSNPEEPAHADISILSSSRELTAQEECNITESDGEWFDEIEEKAFEKADDEYEYAYDQWCEAKREEALFEKYTLV